MLILDLTDLNLIWTVGGAINAVQNDLFRFNSYLSASELKRRCEKL